jgi:lipopolysaccharide cholinephosphotransferase
MTELQNRILSVYETFKKICDERGLRYYTEGGTKIGAAYWKGFIPWDDDMDIVMPIKDYCEFIKLSDDDLPDNIAIFDGFRSKTSDIVFSKLHDTSTTFINNMHLPYVDNYTGVFIDIFPLIGLPESHDDRISFVRRIVELVCRIGRGKSLGEFDSADIARSEKELKEMSFEFDYEESSFIAPVHPSSNREIFEKKHFDRAVDVKFERSSIYRPRHAKEQIDTQYPGFQKVPKDTERTGHGGLIDLGSPVSQYKEKYKNDKSLTDCFFALNKIIRGVKDKNAELRQDPFFVRPSVKE